MASDESPKSSDSAVSASGEKTLVPPTPDENDKGKSSFATGGVGDGQPPFRSAVPNLSDELRTLKTKLLELESKAKLDPNSQPLEDPPLRPPPSEMTAEMEQYKRMENCLYRHRKEWWQNTKEPSYNMMLDTGWVRNADMHGPWSYNWTFGDQYRAPRGSKILDHDHECKEDIPSEFDEYNLEIMYGARRERIRKNFEWDLDRLFLAEEVEKRRRKRKMEGKPKDPDKTEEVDHNMEAGAFVPTHTEPRLNLLGWLTFCQPKFIEGKDSCVIDVLIGDPVINDSFGSFQGWYGYTEPSSGKPATSTQSEASLTLGDMKRPLVERIRIHSDILGQILSKILNKAVEFLQTDQRMSTFVFVRPFKALSFSEPGLRAWCIALEKKFKLLEKGNPVGTVEDKTSENETDQKDLLNDQNQAAEAANDDPHQEVHSEANRNEEEKKNEKEKEKKEGQEGGDEDPNDVTKSKVALDHLKCLLNFIDSEIVARKSFLDSPSCRKVFFSDLWHLFRPGDEVIGKDGMQAYRVLSVTSPRHSVVPAWQSWHSNKRQKPPFSVQCVYIDFDGTHIGPVQKSFDFKRYEGEREINSLEVYPLRFHQVKKSDYGETEWAKLVSLPVEKRCRQVLLDRGTKFLEVAGIKQMYYAGPTLEVRDEIESQVVIDFETAFSVEDDSQRGWKPQLEVLLGDPATKEKEPDDEEIERPCYAECCRLDKVYDDSYIDNEQRTEYINNILPKSHGVDEQPPISVLPRPLSELRDEVKRGVHKWLDEDKVIMSYRVFGFVFRSRKWAQLDLTHLTDAYPTKQPSLTNFSAAPEAEDGKKKYKTSFEHLVLEEGHKPMIQSLIAQHFRDKQQSKSTSTEQVDIVKGKGKGLILLLHGAPGVGKTSTAEGVAEEFKKPLFQITCVDIPTGDLGTTAKEIEKALETTFALANRWDCILLMDEADVFLAERSKEDFKRNGLVAVFLRVMEYYAGILFLTTNRVGDFDEAFASRIHISLYYPELNESKTLQIFKLNLDMIQQRFDDRRRRIVIDRNDTEVFAIKHFVEHPYGKWNGRQIRNACQTALALAEFEAQGNDHNEVLKPDAVVHLKVAHFQVVQKAYLEFARHIKEIYGEAAERAREFHIRAKESNLAPIWYDPSGGVVGVGPPAAMGHGMPKTDLEGTVFYQSHGQQHGQPGNQQSQPPPQHRFQQQQQYQPGAPVGVQYVSNPTAQTVYYSAPNVPQPAYTPAPTQMPIQQQQQQYVSQPWAGQTSNVTFPGQGEGQQPPQQGYSAIPPAMTTAQQRQQQQPPTNMP